MKGGERVEIIGLILVIIFVLVSANDRKKKAAKRADNAGASLRQPQDQGAAARPQAAPRPQAAARPQAKGTPVSQMSLAEREARLNELKQKREARRAAAKTGGFQTAFENTLTDLKELLEVELQAAPTEGESLLSDADCQGGSMPHTHAEGQSALEDEECVGGSMPHSHTQGESRAAQRRRLSSLDRDGEDAYDSLVPNAIDARELRWAVVMAEVLGKPKALRRAG